MVPLATGATAVPEARRPAPGGRRGVRPFGASGARGMAFDFSPAELRQNHMKKHVNDQNVEKGHFWPDSV